MEWNATPVDRRHVFMTRMSRAFRQESRESPDACVEMSQVNILTGWTGVDHVSNIL